jgi:hypothetical protein
MNQNVQQLAEKIALLLQSDEKQDDNTFLRQSLEKINSRLDKIESQLSNPQSQIINHKSLHPSQEKFKIIEELVDEIIANQTGEKPCIFEEKKPCDNCSMCNSRGF